MFNIMDITVVYFIHGKITPPHSCRIRAKVPLQELTVLPDGSLIRPNDSGYNDTSIRTNNQTSNQTNKDIRTCVEGCSCSSQDNEMPDNRSEGGDTQTDTQTHGDCNKILNVTQPEDERQGESSVVPRRPSASSDGSYCDCNFCLQNGGDQPQLPEPQDPLKRFREMHDTPASECNNMVEPEQYDQQETHGLSHQTLRLGEESYSSQVTRFRDVHQETWLNSDDSMASSMSSFNCQDDIVASSPQSYDITNTCDDVMNQPDDVTNGVSHDDTALMLGSLMLLPASTPHVLGRPVRGLTDSMVVLGSNSHVSRLSDSEDET